LRDLSEKRKYPRLLLAHSDSEYRAIVGSQILWPRGGKSQVLDMSYAGIAIEAPGVGDSLKIGEFIEAHLLLPTENQLRIPVALRVIRKTSSVVGLRVDSTSVDGRIKIDQTLKDQIVENAMRSLTTESLPQELHASSWFHGPFDTNIFIWNTENRISKLFIEYDNSILQFENGQFIVGRTSSTAPEESGYGSPFFTKELHLQKLSLGKSWLDRVLKLISQVKNSTKDLELVKELVLGARKEFV
jgi:hypothetical protein